MKNINLWLIVSLSPYGLRELQVSFVLQPLLCMTPLQVLGIKPSVFCQYKTDGLASDKAKSKMSFRVKNRPSARELSSLNFSNSVKMSFHWDASGVNLVSIIISTSWTLFSAAIFLNFPLPFILHLFLSLSIYDLLSESYIILLICVPGWPVLLSCLSAQSNFAHPISLLIIFSSSACFFFTTCCLLDLLQPYVS